MAETLRSRILAKIQFSVDKSGIQKARESVRGLRGSLRRAVQPAVDIGKQFRDGVLDVDRLVDGTREMRRNMEADLPDVNQLAAGMRMVNTDMNALTEMANAGTGIFNRNASLMRQTAFNVGLTTQEFQNVLTNARALGATEQELVARAKELNAVFRKGGQPAQKLRSGLESVAVQTDLTTKNALKLNDTLTGGFISGEKALKRMEDQMGRFKFGFLSLLFFSMALKRVFMGFLRSAFQTFKKVGGMQTDFGRQLQATSASWEFFKFSIFEALGGLISAFLPALIRLLDTLATADVFGIPLRSVIAFSAGLIAALATITLAWAQYKLFFQASVIKEVVPATLRVGGSMRTTAATVVSKLVVMSKSLITFVSTWVKSHVVMAATSRTAAIASIGSFLSMIGLFVLIIAGLVLLKTFWKEIWLGIVGFLGMIIREVMLPLFNSLIDKVIKTFEIFEKVGKFLGLLSEDSRSLSSELSNLKKDFNDLTHAQGEWIDGQIAAQKEATKGMSVMDRLKKTIDDTTASLGLRVPEGGSDDSFFVGGNGSGKSTTVNDQSNTTFEINLMQSPEEASQQAIDAILDAVDQAEKERKDRQSVGD